MAESEKKIIVALMLCGLFVVSQVYLFIPLVLLLQKNLFISHSNALWVISAFSLSYASGFLLLGPLSDRFSKKRLMLIGLVLLSAITFVIGFIHNFTTLIIFRILQGLAASTFAPTAMAYVSELSSENSRVIGLSLLIMSFALAGIFGQVYASIVSEILGLQWVFWLLGSVYIIMTFFIAPKLSAGKKIKTSSPVFDTYKNMLLHFKNPALVLLYVITFIILMSFVSVYDILGDYLNQRFGLALQNVFYIRMAGIPSMCLSPVAGYFARKIGGSTITIIGLIILILGLLFESLSSSLPHFTLSSALFDAGIAITTPGIVIMINKAAQQAKGSAMSLYTFFLFFGAGLGPLVSSELYKHGFSGVCYAFAALFFVCILMLSFASKKLKNNLIGSFNFTPKQSMTK